jgi:Spy/CpxP family protein refolding chaperone
MVPTPYKSPSGAKSLGEKEQNMRHFLRRRGRHSEFSESGCGSTGCESWRGHFMRHRHHHQEEDDGGFGVRRPLRFLAYKLELSQEQITRLVRILDELKTERAQSAVDDRRTLAEFADAIGGDAFDAAKAQSAGERRVSSAAKLRDTLIRSLQQIHALLTPQQRERLAYFIRTGILAV